MECSLESVYEAFHDPLRRFILARVSDADTADDVLQDVYLRIHTHIDSVRDCARLQAWVYQIARNAIIDYYRSRRPADEVPESLALPDDPCEGDVECEIMDGFAAMIDELPEKYRRALALTVYEGLTQAEVAARLGISLSGAKSRVQRARAMLRDMLLQCCHFEFDRYGAILGYQARCCCCAPEHAGPQPISLL